MNVSFTRSRESKRPKSAHAGALRSPVSIGADRPPVSAGDGSGRVAECEDQQAWDAYVERSGAGVFHRWQWGAALRVYGLPMYRLAAYRDGQIVGVLPLVHQRSRLFGSHLVSMPWFDSTGVVADDDIAARDLVDAAESLRKSLGASTVQLRQQCEDGYSPQCRRDKVLMRLKLTRDPQELWNDFKATVRNQVRKAEKSGLCVKCGGPELLRRFFDVYSHNMRDLGSPSHSLAFFDAVCRAFPNEVRLCVVMRHKQAVGAGLTIANGPVLEIPWASSLRKCNGLCVNHAMYWRILHGACRRGFEWFHFGRSTRDSGTYRFKKQWGAEPAPLYWYLLGDDAAAAKAANPQHPDFALASYLWQRMPVWLARGLGPPVISKVP